MMEMKVEFNRYVLANALADIIEEEKRKPCDVHDKLRRYVADGVEDVDTRWALDVMTTAADKAMEIA